MGWSDLDPDKRETADKEKAAREDKVRALASAAIRAFQREDQELLLNFLLTKAYTISYKPGADPAEVAFYEGQRSMALQLLKLAGEIK